MRERPILFSGEMVRAILAGEKTQTRRVATKDPSTKSIEWVEDAETLPAGDLYTGWAKHCGAPVCIPLKCPHGFPGDVLWIRETWARHTLCGSDPAEFIVMKADGSSWQCKNDGPPDRCCHKMDYPDWGVSRWRPSIHMPRWASRLSLLITDIRVERVQEISEEDAVAEGVDGDPLPELSSDEIELLDYPLWDEARPAASRFSLLWDSINGKRGFGWEKNSWVWCVSFEPIKP